MKCSWWKFTVRSRRAPGHLLLPNQFQKRLNCLLLISEEKLPGDSPVFLHDVVFLIDRHLTNRFHVAVRLFSNRSQMTSKCGKNNEVAHEPQASLWLMFLPHFDVLCDLLLNRPTATWNLFVLYNDQKRKKTDTNACLVPLDCSRICASLGIC